MFNAKVAAVFAFALGAAVFTNSATAQSLPAGVSFSGAVETSLAHSQSTSGGVWSDTNTQQYLGFSLGFDGQEAGIGPFGFEISGSVWFSQNYLLGAPVRKASGILGYGSLYYDTGFGRFTVGRPPAMLLDYIDILAAGPSASQIAAYGFYQPGIVGRIQKVYNDPASLTIDQPYLAIQYDSPWFNTGANGRLRFGLEELQTGFAISGFPQGTGFTSAAVRYENADLSLGASLTYASQASSSGTGQTSYNLTAKYDAGRWYAGASYSGNWLNTGASQIDYAIVQGGYRPNENLEFTVQYERYSTISGTVAPRDRMLVNAQYTFDNNFYVGVNLFQGLSGPIADLRAQRIYAGWSFDLGG